MPANVLLPLTWFVAMGCVVLFALWRIVVVGGEARRVAHGYRIASDVAHRADGWIADAAGMIDAMRRRQVEPEEMASPLAAASAALGALASEVRAGLPRQPSPSMTALVEELDRAQRALELVDYGRGLLASADRLGEGETSIKRGYLNLLHARDAIRLRGVEIRAATPGSATRTA